MADRGRVERVLFITHPQVRVDPAVPVPEWGLSDAGRGLQPRTLYELGENDRSATGFVEPEEFEAMADRFFAEPGSSVEGWEPAVAAQRRIAAATDHVLASSPPGDVAIVAHGGVGTLLLCALQGVPITRALDQPGQGHWFAFERASRSVLHGWRRLESHN